MFHFGVKRFSSSLDVSAYDLRKVLLRASDSLKRKWSIAWKGSGKHHETFISTEVPRYSLPEKTMLLGWREVHE